MTWWWWQMIRAAVCGTRCPSRPGPAARRRYTRGIQAAIAWSAHDHCLVVACDMPFLSLALLRRMADEPRNYDVLVPLIPGESRQRDDGLVFQTLHAIYSKRCLPFIEKQIAEGKTGR